MGQEVSVITSVGSGMVMVWNNELFDSRQGYERACEESQKTVRRMKPLHGRERGRPPNLERDLPSLTTTLHDMRRRCHTTRAHSVLLQECAQLTKLRQIIDTCLRQGEYVTCILQSNPAAPPPGVVQRRLANLHQTNAVLLPVNYHRRRAGDLQSKMRNI